MSLRALALAALEHVTRGELTGVWSPALEVAERLAAGLRAKVDAAPKAPPRASRPGPPDVETGPEPARPRGGALARALARGEQLSAEELATIHPDELPRRALDPYEGDRAWR